MARTALVVVDLQTGFINEHTSHVVSRVAELVEAGIASDVDIVFTRFLNSPKSAYERLLGWTAVQAPPETDIVTELREAATSVVEKRHYTGFTKEFERLVRERGWERLLLCGIATEACVMKTAVDAFERGLTPIVVHDACASDGGPEAHEAGLLVLRRLIGAAQIVDVAAARGMLAGIL